MSASFQPIALGQPRKAGADRFRLKVISNGADTQPAFAPIAAKGAKPAGPTKPTAAGTAPAACAAPKVSVERDGQRVKMISIECGCGQIHKLECEYPAPPAPPAR